VVYEHQSRDVDTVIIDGEVVLQNGKPVHFDEMDILSQSNAALSDLLNRLSEPLRSEVIG